MTNTNKNEQLEALHNLYKACKHCPLASLGRQQVVFGEGNPNAPLLFLGEGPGREEDKVGRPFIGRSGQLLRKTIAKIGLKPEDYYITNVVKCRPPTNRLPNKGEISPCTKLILKRELDIIQPKVICSLGSCATKVILEEKLIRMTDARKKIINKNGLSVKPVFHPAYILRNSKMRDMWILDLKQAFDLSKNS